MAGKRDIILAFLSALTDIVIIYDFVNSINFMQTIVSKTLFISENALIKTLPIGYDHPKEFQRGIFISHNKEDPRLIVNPQMDIRLYYSVSLLQKQYGKANNTIPPNILPNTTGIRLLAYPPQFTTSLDEA